MERNSSFVFHGGYRGFTLIELLVVVAIIGLLSSVVISGMVSVRERAYMARSGTDYQTLQKALELYYLTNGRYPLNNAGTYNVSSWNSFMTQLSPYLPRQVFPPYPSIIDADSGLVAQGYTYYRGSASVPNKIKLFDGANGNVFVNCVVVNDGYYLDLLPPGPQQVPARNDGGYDPDGFDVAGGDFRVTKTQTDCN